MFVVPIDKELDLKKAAKAAGEKSVEMIHVKDINKITEIYSWRLYSNRHEEGLSNRS